jgi:glycosyltransferase involved in cell wall biosynthesis
MRELTVCAIFRDEAPYLAEWIEFHRIAGVEHFELYDNGSTDQSREILAPYVATGVVTLHEWHIRPGQLSAYLDAIALTRGKTRWAAFIDVDEFLFAPSTVPLPNVLSDYLRYPAVGVNWNVFGTSGHKQKPSGLVIENYTRRTRDSSLNRHIKSIVQPERVRLIRPFDPHHFKYLAGLAVNERFMPIIGPFSDPPERDILRINHYWSKSEDEALAKAGRERADNGELRAIEHLLDPKLNTVRDVAIGPFVPKVKRALFERERGRW